MLSNQIDAVPDSKKIIGIYYDGFSVQNIEENIDKSKEALESSKKEKEELKKKIEELEKKKDGEESNIRSLNQKDKELDQKIYDLQNNINHLEKIKKIISNRGTNNNPQYYLYWKKDLNDFSSNVIEKVGATSSENLLIILKSKINNKNSPIFKKLYNKLENIINTNTPTTSSISSIPPAPTISTTQNNDNIKNILDAIKDNVSWNQNKKNIEHLIKSNIKNNDNIKNISQDDFKKIINKVIKTHKEKKNSNDLNNDIIKIINDSFLTLFNITESKTSTTGESYVLMIQGKKMLLESYKKKLLKEDISEDESKFEKFNIDYFKGKYDEIEKQEKHIQKVDDTKKEGLIKDIEKAKKDLKEKMIFQIVRNTYEVIKSLKNPESNASQKVTSDIKGKIGFEPTPLNFAMNSLLKFQTMTKFSRSISNFVLNIVLSQMEQLNIIYSIISNDKLNRDELINLYRGYESNLRNLQNGMQGDKAVKSFEDLIDKIEENFGAESEIYNNIKQIHQGIISNFKEMNNKQGEFKNVLTQFVESYESLKTEEEKNQLRIEMIKKFIEIKNSKELKNLYSIYLKNINFFEGVLSKIKNENNQIGLGVLLEKNSKETFDRIYAEEKNNFDQTFSKTDKILGKGVGQGQLNELFVSMEQKLKELQSKPVKNKENPKEAENKKQEENPESEKSDNINTKQDKENKTEEKPESSDIK